MFRAAATSLRVSAPPRQSVSRRSVSSIPFARDELRSSKRQRLCLVASRTIVTSQPEDATTVDKTEKELEIEAKLRSVFEDADVEVADTSGNCGRSFAISISSSAFRGMLPVARHKLVAKALKDDIKQWHAVQFKTVQK